MALSVIDSGSGLQALLDSTDALARAAASTNDRPDEASAESIAQHMQEILRQHVALHASGVALRGAGVKHAAIVVLTLQET